MTYQYIKVLNLCNIAVNVASMISGNGLETVRFAQKEPLIQFVHYIQHESASLLRI